MIVSCCSVILAVTWLLDSYIAGSALFHMGSLLQVVMYVWARRNSHAHCQVLFVVVKAPYLPYVMAALSLILGGKILNSALGLFAGHVYFFFTDIYPRCPTSGGFKLFKTPWLLERALNPVNWFVNFKHSRPILYSITGRHINDLIFCDQQLPFRTINFEKIFPQSSIFAWVLFARKVVWDFWIKSRICSCMCLE